MAGNARCPDCENTLSESTSERGDYFCPECKKPVRSSEATFYCAECGEQEVVSARAKCSSCRDQSGDASDGGTGRSQYVWGEESSDDLHGLAARDCPGCGVALIPFNFVLQPLHDGKGNYYVGHSCPHCDEILYRSRAAGGEQLAGHAKERAERDPDPPTDLSELEEIELEP